MTIALEKPHQQTEISRPVDQNTVRRRGTGLRAYNPAKAFKGYTLFTPLTGQGEIYLIDIEGNVVHEWKLPYPPGLYAYFLPNGNLFYNGKTVENPPRFPAWQNFKGGIPTSRSSP
jgi:hypothetical protein